MGYIKSFVVRRIILLFGILSLGLVAIGFGPLLASSPASMQAVTIESIKSGDWSDPQVWNSGVVPQAGEAVVIHAGNTVVYNIVNDAVLDQISVEGVLYFSRQASTRLKVQNHILVREGGYLDMGTPTDYLPANIKAEITFVLTKAQTDAFVGTANGSGGDPHGEHGASHFESPDVGLWVFDRGRWDLHGSPLMRTWSKLAADVPAGAGTVVVENNVGDWYVGGKIVLTSTRNPQQFRIRSSDQKEVSDTFIEHELRNIEAVEVLDNGQTRLTLDQPLAFAHAGTAPFQGEVALLSRNILISTELVDVDEARFVDVRTRKFAHTMYMPGARGNIQYGEFKRLGYYGLLGRYPIHHHRMLESSNGMAVRGNAIWETGFRCVNLHITHGVTLEDNVCYSPVSTAYFVEEDERQQNVPEGYRRGYSQDNVFVHNIAIASNPKHFEDRNNDAIAGEMRRMGAFWPGSETQHEAYLGNVAVGGKEFEDAAGFSFPEDGNEMKSQGQIPFTFVSNEVHSSAAHGIFSWQNASNIYRDLVDTRLWRNGDAGIRWGAYGMAAFYFNAQLLENGRSALNITSVNAFLQDSIVTGSQADGSRSDRGFAITGYILPQYPNPGVWIVRNVFKNLPTSGISQVDRVVPGSNIDSLECDMHDFVPNPPFDLKQRPVWAGDCSAFYITMMGNQFENVPRPLVFGHAPNPNSYWKVFDYKGGETAQKDFVLLRADQNQPEQQGVITQKLVTPEVEQNAGLNALVVPMGSLPPEGVEFTGLLNHRTADTQKRSDPADFTFATQPDYPPNVKLEVIPNGETATMRATADDDRGVTRLEFFVDWKNVGTQTLSAGAGSAPPAEVTVDLSNYPRKYAYLYVRAFDGTKQLGDYEQRAYSNVVEIGPEVLGTVKQSADTGIPGGANDQYDYHMLLPSLKS
ncbi:MAG: hypothetical protein IT328_19620 [Caldilineaceae bacterium]|nr:hypothetical protein [Caldilineaceae bacterium]